MASAAQDPKTQKLPPLKNGEMAQVLSIALKGKETKAPPKYTEGTLLGDMEAAAKFIENDPELRSMLRGVTGIGTAATRDATIEGLKHDRYIEKSGKYLVPTAKGVSFIVWLEKYMPELTSVEMTARWEAELALVAQRGGGAAFEKNVAALVEKFVSTMKTAEPLHFEGARNQPTNKESENMSENTPRVSKPTDKMLEFAKNIASRVGARVPDEVMTDFDACKAFIDSNKDAAMRPSDKQLSFANSIAERKGVTIPEEIKANGRELSLWIDANK
jgi:DNA topoisomerase III